MAGYKDVSTLFILIQLAVFPSCLTPYPLFFFHHSPPTAASEASALSTTYAWSINLDVVMVSQTIHGAMTEMHHADPDHPPWNFPTWQIVTKISHGLFPKEDDKLPEGMLMLPKSAVAD